LVTTLPNLVAYLRRIDAEEAMLADSLGGEYRS
jgi:protein-S-isoprenylcysteine O-methyltransferase Ste14